MTTLVHRSPDAGAGWLPGHQKPGADGRSGCRAPPRHPRDAPAGAEGTHGATRAVRPCGHRCLGCRSRRTPASSGSTGPSARRQRIMAPKEGDFLGEGHAGKIQRPRVRTVNAHEVPCSNSQGTPFPGLHVVKPSTELRGPRSNDLPVFSRCPFTDVDESPSRPSAKRRRHAAPRIPLRCCRSV